VFNGDGRVLGPSLGFELARFRIDSDHGGAVMGCPINFPTWHSTSEVLKKLVVTGLFLGVNWYKIELKIHKKNKNPKNPYFHSSYDH
jgi:hypothetical protein